MTQDSGTDGGPTMIGSQVTGGSDGDGSDGSHGGTEDGHEHGIDDPVVRDLMEDLADESGTLDMVMGDGTDEIIRDGTGSASGAGRLTSAAAAGTPTDGRLLRSQRTKRAIVDALLDLIREGHLKPSSAEIADRAGVTQRTLFNQFGDMDSLLRAIAARHAARVTPLIPNVTIGTLEERTHEFCSQLAGLLEEVMQIRWAIITQSTQGDRLVRGSEVLTQVLRHQLQETFAPELRQLDEADRAATLDILEIEADPITWRLRRLQQRKSIDEAAEALERAIRLVLDHVVEAV
jgi:AcrR family transcriptional regulator